MLELRKSRFHPSLSVFQPTRAVELSPVADEDDELIQAIIDHREETWQLEATPDASGLASFWTGVEQDLHDDPEWVNFAEDE